MTDTERKDLAIGEPPALGASNAEWKKWAIENPVHDWGSDLKCKICGSELREGTATLCKR